MADAIHPYEVADRPVTIPELCASIFRAFGFDPAREYNTTASRPVRLVDHGDVVQELFA